jgi:hypothetical protein
MWVSHGLSHDWFEQSKIHVPLSVQLALMTLTSLGSSVMTIRRIRVDAGTQLFLHDLYLDGLLSYVRCTCQGDAYHKTTLSCHQLLYVDSSWSLESRNYEVENAFFRYRCRRRHIKRAAKIEAKRPPRQQCNLHAWTLTHLANAGLCTGFA